MSKLSRTKGHAFERSVARDMSEASKRRYRRVLVETQQGNSGDVRADNERADPIAVAAIRRTHRGGEQFAAVPWGDWLEIVSALDAYDFVVQCKCGKRPDIYGALTQAEEARDG